MNVENDIPYQIQDESIICIFCGRGSLTLVDIHSEKLENDFPSKIEKYLPLKLEEFSNLSLKCCWECVSTIVSWHKFFQKCAETSKQLKELNEKLDRDEFTEDRIHDEIEDVRPVTEILYINYAEVRKEENSEKIPDSIDELHENSGENYKKIVSPPATHPVQSKQCLNVQVADPEEHPGVSEGKIFKETCEKSFEVAQESIENESRNKKLKIRRKNNEFVKEFICESCGMGYSRKFDLHRHVLLKHPEIKSDYTPTRANNDDVLNKCRIFADGKKFFECDICKHRTKRSYSLIRHRTVHSEFKEYICEICGLGFRLQYSLERHKKQKHLEKFFKCEICQKRFGVKFALDDHMLIHSDQRPFSCDICTKSFKQKASLFVHKKFHTQNFNFNCLICDKKFRRSHELVVHNRVHTGEKPYACDECGIRFTRLQQMQKHKKVHLKGNRQWACPDCKCSFSEERYLKLHKRIHIPVLDDNE